MTHKKNNLCSILVILAIGSLASCTKESFEINDLKRESSTKLISPRVSSEDIDQLLKLRGRADKTKAGNPVIETIPVIDEQQDTVMFIINYASGWEIISADKRTPQSLASSEIGNLSQENKAQWFWINKMKSDMSAVLHSTDEQLSFSREEIESNLALWGFPDIPVDTFVDDNTAHGHYELYSISDRIEFVDGIDHLTTTRWHQEDPFNYYCPDKTGSNGGKCPAGCAPVAAAQMLYFLQRQNQVPALYYSSATCIGDKDNFNQYFYNPGPDVWDYMSIMHYDDYNNYVAILMADAGNLMHAMYGNNVTQTLSILGNPFQDFFQFYGYSCTRSSYNEAIVKSSLLNNCPVIVEAQESLIGNIPSPSEGHAFIIDGYKRERQVYTYVYRWYDDLTHSFDNSEHFDLIDQRTSSSDITKIKMNWGWMSQWEQRYLGNDIYHNYDNSGWYSLTGGWATTYGTYDSFIRIIHNFQLL